MARTGRAGLLSRLLRLRDADEVAHRAASAIAEAAHDAIAERGVFAIALAGGDTPRRTYTRLASDGRVDWPRVEFFFGDERAVPPDHPDSNYAMARAALLAPRGIAAQRIHRMEGERADLAAAARDYERELARVLGGAPGGDPPPVDLVLLGMGPDGHTASLFPHTAALAETQRWVVANEVPQIAARRITFTFPLIERARAVLVLVTGEAKATALAEVLEGPPDPERLPSQRLRERANWLVDGPAASLLRRSE
jgi:6-phosphogluconolactonase